jgi:ADP-ribosylglycohydrolase
MLGAIAGDVIGSVFEGRDLKSEDFALFSEHSSFTDDTVMTVAVAAWTLDGLDLAVALRKFGRRYPWHGYGMSFLEWLFDETKGPYDSWGNGSAMRVSPVAWAFDDMEEVLRHAERSAEVTHNHPEGIRGAQATALAIFLGRRGVDKRDIRSQVELRCGYDLSRRVDDIRPGYGFDVSCQGSVPEAIICFLESKDFESAIRLAVSLGGDTDTMACIAGAIAEAHYGGVPEAIAAEVRKRLPEDLLDVVDRFRARYCSTRAPGTKT